MYEELVALLRKKYDKDPMVMEAADAIEVLTTVAKGYKRSMEAWADEAARAKPRWIPVTERLPKNDGDYLVWYLIEDGADPCVGIFPFDSNVPAFGYWDEYYDPVTYGWAGSDFIELHGITHWMPLPKAPEPLKENKYVRETN